nr:class I SAM-dependent methyltransferase [Oscillospiraceae bacterium]
MNIESQFNLIAEEYDVNRRKFIPCFDDYYQNTTAFIASNMQAPERIIDLGSGTGLLAYYWYQHFPDSEYLLVDIAEDMLRIARKRFQGIQNVSCQSANYIEELPEMPFDMVISALSIHHLENQEKEVLFSRIFDALPAGGLFVNYDQFCAGTPALN